MDKTNITTQQTHEPKPQGRYEELTAEGLGLEE